MKQCSAVRCSAMHCSSVRYDALQSSVFCTSNKEELTRETTVKDTLLWCQPDGSPRIVEMFFFVFLFFFKFNERVFL